MLESTAIPQSYHTGFIYSSDIHVFTSSLFNRPLAKYHLSRVRPILLRDFPLHQWGTRRRGSPAITLMGRLYESFWTRGRRGDCCVCVLCHLGPREQESRVLRTNIYPLELGGQPVGQESTVEERHCQRHHRPRTLQILPGCKVPPAKGAQEEHHPNNSRRRLV